MPLNQQKRKELKTAEVYTMSMAQSFDDDVFKYALGFMTINENVAKQKLYTLYPFPTSPEETTAFDAVCSKQEEKREKEATGLAAFLWNSFPPHTVYVVPLETEGNVV